MKLPYGKVLAGLNIGLLLSLASVYYSSHHKLWYPHSIYGMLNDFAMYAIVVFLALILSCLLAWGGSSLWLRVRQEKTVAVLFMTHAKAGLAVTGTFTAMATSLFIATGEGDDPFGIYKPGTLPRAPVHESGVITSDPVRAAQLGESLGVPYQVRIRERALDLCVTTSDNAAMLAMYACARSAERPTEHHWDVNVISVRGRILASCRMASWWP